MLTVNRFPVLLTLLLVPLGALAAAPAAQAQFNIPGLKIPGLKIPGLPQPKMPDINLPGPEMLTKQEEPVTTNIKDVRGEAFVLDSYSPVQVKPLSSLKRGPGGGWLLRPGLYSGDVRSYCLHAGTYGPTRGEGYLYAPLKGKRSGIIRKILHNSADHPDLSQSDVQTLIWALESRTKFSDLSPGYQRTASTLLSPEDILELNGSSLDYITEQYQDQVFGKVTDTLRPILQVQNQLRGLLTQADAPFEQLERVAVLNGDPPKDKNSREIPAGRWCLHPGGYFVRYLPSTYSHTTLYVYVPERFILKRDARGRIISVKNAQGFGVETSYDDTIPSLDTSTQEMKAYHFSSIRLIVPDATTPSGKLVKVYKNVGWTYVGYPTTRTIQVSSNAAYPGSVSRLNEELQWLRQMDSFQSDFQPNLGRKRPGRRSGADCFDLVSYRLGIEDALRQVGVYPPVAGGVSFVPIFDLLYNAWQWEIGPWVFDTPDSPADPGQGDPGQGDPGQTDPGQTEPEYDPSGDVATPGDTGRQRLGQSLLPYETSAN